jgi:hypothetical protein
MLIAATYAQPGLLKFSETISASNVSSQKLLKMFKSHALEKTKSVATAPIYFMSETYGRCHTFMIYQDPSEFAVRIIERYEVQSSDLRRLPVH